jgi:hypothetical protein
LKDPPFAKHVYRNYNTADRRIIGYASPCGFPNGKGGSKNDVLQLIKLPHEPFEPSHVVDAQEN